MPLLIHSALKNSCDGEALARLASKVPAVRRTGDRAADRVKTIQRDALVRIVDQLSKIPEYILPLHGVMMSEDLIVNMKQQHRLEWSGDYKVLASIPVAWEVQYLASRAAPLGIALSAETLDAIEGRTPDDIKLLFSFDIQCAMTLPFPADCKDPKVASLTFAARAHTVGDRLRTLFDKGGFKQPGRVTFTSACYTLQFDEANVFVKQVKHIGGETADIPPHVRVTREYNLVDNHLDQMAKVECPPVSYTLASFFAATAAFKVNMQVPGKRFKLLARVAELTTVGNNEKKAAEEAPIVQVNVKKAEKLMKERSQATLKKAREQAAAVQDARKKRRIISLGGEALTPVLQG